MIQCGKRLAAQSSWINQQVDFYLINYGADGQRTLATNVTFERQVDGLEYRPTFSLGRDVAQELFEQMWAQGFRSANDKGSGDRLDQARQEHLADLRKAAKLA